jgi:hypothetical protein
MKFSRQKIRRERPVLPPDAARAAGLAAAPAGMYFRT